jgi:hypothetical protein
MGIVPFRKRDFDVAVLLDQVDPTALVELAGAICRARPSRLDNVLEIKVFHKPDRRVHQVVQIICDKGIRALTLRTECQVRLAISADQRAYMEFAYEVGKVLDQWTDLSRCGADGDELMVDVIKIAFERKMITNCVWETEGGSHV